jgi:multiple sugar transport system permease protein
MKRTLLQKIGLAFAVLVIISPACLFFLWMISLSLKPEIDNTAYPPVIIPSMLDWSNYTAMLTEHDFVRYFTNSLIVTGSAVILALIVGVPAAYGIARARAHKLAVVVMIARMTPALSFLIPLFLLFQYLGLMRSLWPQIITHLVVTIPVVIWIMTSFFESLPVELEEASRIDGADRWQVFRLIALPLARPGIMVALILAVIFSWNNFVFGIVLAGRTTRTLPVAVYNSLTYEQISWGPLSAAAILVTLPVLLLTVVAQKQIVQGMTSGAVK